jgi:hypothetical protein
MTEWDPVSKQPLHKIAAARVTRLAPGERSGGAPTTGGSAPVAADVAVGGNDALVEESVAVADPPTPPPSPPHTPGVPLPVTPAGRR